MILARILKPRFVVRLPLCKFTQQNVVSDQKEVVIVPEVEERIMNILRQSPKCITDKLTNEATFEELGFDSLDAVELVVAFEEDLNYDIPDEEATNSIKKVKDAITVFSKYYNQKSSAQTEQ